MDSKLTGAQVAAWNVYMTRVDAQLKRQLRAYESGSESVAMTICPPCDAEVQIIQRAMDNAKREIVSAALAPLVRAIDAVDNSRSKSPTVAEARAAMQAAYDELHRLKASPQPLPDPPQEPTA